MSKIIEEQQVEVVCADCRIKFRVGGTDWVAEKKTGTKLVAEHTWCPMCKKQINLTGDEFKSWIPIDEVGEVFVMRK